MTRIENELDFRDKTAIVTGSGRNIGRAIALEFASRGANVIVNTRQNEQEAADVARAVDELGGTALIAMGDVSDADTVNRIATAAIERFGRVDISVSCAARRLSRSFDELTNEEWHRHLNQQLTASWYLAKAFVPGMREAGWGRIIHINGVDGWYGGHLRLPHSAAKAALHTLSKGLSTELAQFGITFNDIVPGFVDTIRDPVTHPQIDDRFRQDAVGNKIPTRRLVTAEEIAWVCTFLASERAGSITGAAIHIDGGQHMRG